MPSTSGPTQMDYASAEKGTDSESWDGRPALARAIRVVLWLLPLLGSLIFGFWVSHAFPPEYFGLNKWVWWVGLAVVATVLTRVLEKLTKKLTPLTMLMRLSLIFPDQAPSRFSSALRTGTTTKTKKRLKAIQDGGGALDGNDSIAAQMIDMIGILSKHDKMTRGHAERVRAYTDLLAEELELDTEDAGKLRWGALLHDMGKLSVPAEILNKPGRPDAEEWKILQGHPAAAIPHLEPIAEWLGEWRHAADGHHERWDGGGYPLGLAGKDIPLAARIVAVADAYDVMTSTRSYKKALPPEVAREEIANNAGSQFDPEVARAFLNIGLGDLRRATGPLAWLAGLPGIRNVPLGTAASPVVAPVVSAVSAIVVATAGVIGGVTPQTQPEPQLAFATPVEIVQADDIQANEGDREISGLITATGDGQLTITIISPPENGTIPDGIRVSQDRQSDRTTFGYEYDPDPGFVGTDSVVVEICAPAGDCAQETIEIAIAGVENRPESPNQSARVDEAGTITLSLPDEAIPAAEGGTAINGAIELPGGGVIAQAGGTTAGLLQASDADGDALNIFLDEDSVTNGTAQVVGRSIVFSHDGSETTEATLRYAVTDGKTSSTPGTISITVAALNDDPVAEDDAITVKGNTSSVIAGSTLTDNDTDVDSAALTVISATGAANGSLAVLSGAVEYTHDGSSAGTDSFTYVVADGSGGTATATVEVTIIPAAATTTSTTTTTAAPIAIATTTTTTTTTTIPPNLAPVAFPTQSMSIAENASSGTNVGAVAASDPEGAALSYGIVGASGPFAIAQTTGVVRLAPGATLDFEAVSSYTLAVTATDPGGLSYPITVTITITDINETPAAPAPQTLSIDENLAATLLGSVATTDPDGDTLSYAIITGDPNGLFTISSAGQISTTGPADHEEQAAFGLVVEISDPDGAAVVVPVAVSVVDLNETPVSPGPQSLAIAENQPARRLGSVAATDPDGDLIAYAITAGNSTGLVLTPDGDIFTTSSFDHETDPILSVTVTATDPDGLAVPYPVVITITDVNEYPLSPGAKSFSIDENQPVTSLGSLATTDPDGDALTYAIATGDPAGQLGISTAGVLATTGPIDFESDQAFSLSITITDPGGLQTAVPVMVTINDLNEAPSNSASTATVVEGEFVVIDIAPEHIDPDAGDTFTVTSIPGLGAFSTSTTSSGTSITYTHDGSETTSDTVVYEITDSQGLTADGVLTITITPFNDPPVPVNNPTVITLLEHHPNGPTGEFVTVTDTDDTSHTFTPVGTATYLSINSATGEIIVDDSTLLDLDGAGSFSNGSIGVVNVSDGVNTVPVDVQVFLTPVNEPPVFETGYVVTVPENSAVGTPATVGTVATDPEGGITFTMSPTTGPFAINPTSGEITLTGPVNFETHSGYPITITATDNGTPALTATDNITITITDELEAPTVTPGAVTISEAQSGAFALGMVSWTDEDSSNHTIAIINGNTDADSDGTLPFTIDSSSATLSTVLRLSDADDVVFGSDFALEVEVTDDSGQADTAIITVVVTPRYTASPEVGNLIFNEVLWADRESGSPINNELVEIYNAGSTAIDMSGYTLADIDVTNGETEAQSFSYEFPATTPVIEPGAYVVIFTGEFIAPSELISIGAVFEGHAGSSPALSKTDDLYLFDASDKLAAYMAWGYDGGGSPAFDDVDEIGFRPPASYGLWDLDVAEEQRLGTGPIVQGQSIALALNGDAAASTVSACWEITGATGSNKATCANGPKPTYDNSTDAYPRITSDGNNNNLPISVDNLVISEYASNTSSPATGEFIEIFNPTTKAVNLADYQLQVITGSGNTNVDLQLDAHSLLPGQYYLLTESGNGTLPVAADQLYSTFSLEHRTGLRLHDNIQSVDVDQVGNSQSYDAFGAGAVQPNENPYREQDGVAATEFYPTFNISNQRRSYGTGSCIDGSTDPENNKADFIRNLFPDPQNTNVIEPCDYIDPVNPGPSTGIVISEFRPNGLGNRDDESITVFNASGSAQDITGYKLVRWTANFHDTNSDGVADPSEYQTMYTYGSVNLVDGGHFRVAHDNANSGTKAGADALVPVALVDGYYALEYLLLLRPDGSIADEVSMGPDSAHPAGPLPTSLRFQTRSWVRKHNGCQDTDTNRDDFVFMFVALELDMSDTATPCF